jgi:hypothetical protein
MADLNAAHRAALTSLIRHLVATIYAHPNRDVFRDRIETLAVSPPTRRLST